MKPKNTNTHAKPTTPQTPVKAKRLKLGIDVHADSYRVVRQFDNATPQPAQKFTPKAFLDWVGKQLELAEEVHSCYEAGPFGYKLHRELLKLGVKNLVIRPQDWDERGRGVKTDKTDALAMVLHLAQYLDGHRKALAVITVPTEAQELARAQSRQRERFLKHRLRLEAQGRSTLLYFGYRIRGRWWQPKQWERLQVEVRPEVYALLVPVHELLLAAQAQVEAGQAALEKAATAQPKGVGGMSSQILEREILDWGRFDNRRQVASITGLCPRVWSTGTCIRQGRISKHGNRRLRTALIELAWRIVRFQPEYRGLKKWGPVLLSASSGNGAKQKAITALARLLAVDLWRLHTKRTTAEKLGLKLNA
jgi:transposase